MVMVMMIVWSCSWLSSVFLLFAFCRMCCPAQIEASSNGEISMERIKKIKCVAGGGGGGVEEVCCWDSFGEEPENDPVRKVDSCHRSQLQLSLLK